MECNKEDAAEAKKIAEEKMKAGDFVGAHKFVTKAQRLFPNLENILHMKTICDVHISASKKIKGLDNWYDILQVQPFADANAIKKQYRKLALILHPDKNKCVGTEAAFKLVGEANKWLSDQIKRSQYDIRYRSHLMVANKYADANSCRNSAPANNVAKNIPSDKAFWTCCKHCGYCHKYLKECINTVMYCSACQRSYVACNMGRDGMPTSSSTAGKKEVQDQGIYNTSRQNPSTGAESGSLASMMDKNGSQKHHQKVAGGCTENAAEVSKPQTARTSVDEIPKTDVLNAKRQVQESHTSATKTIPSAPKKDQTAKTMRKAVEESSKSSEVDGSDDAAVKPYTSVYKKRKSSSKKPQSSHAEGKNNGDFVIPPNKKTKSGREFESNLGTKYMAADNRSPKMPDSGASSASSHAYEGKAKKTVNSGNEDILFAKKRESEACDGNREDVALSRKIDRVKVGHRSNENPSEFDIPDQEFNVLTDREIRKGKADGLCHEAPNVKVRANSVTQTTPSPRKRRKSDDDNGVCNNLEKVRGDARKSHGFPSCQVDEPRLRQKFEDRENEFALLKNQIESEKKKLLQLEREMEEVTGRKKKELELVHSKIKESCKQRAALDEQLISQLKLLERQSSELVSKEMELKCVKVSLKQYSSDLKLKEKLVHLLNDRETDCNKMIDLKSEELRKIEKLIEQQTNELAVLYNQGDSIKQLNQELSEKLIAKEMELERVGESSKRLESDLKVKEKRVQALNNQIRISSKQLDLKSKELEEIQRELELKKQLRQMSNVKCEKQPAAASTIDTSGQNAAETESINDDTLMDYEFSVLTHYEVSNVLRASPNPAKFILEQVEEHISSGLGLQEPVLDIFVLFFEELTKIQRSDDQQLQDKATQVGTLWKKNITIKSPKSSIEALAFLLFIVAYGLKRLINIEETALLALSIAHYEQAPRIFHSLNFNSETREFVKELIKKSQYILAVRLICVFKLNEDEVLSPSHLLRKEINNLKRSALEMEPVESSQAKDEDAGKLRAILELVADYNLEINLPGYLIAKLML